MPDEPQTGGKASSRKSSLVVLSTILFAVAGAVVCSQWWPTLRERPTPEAAGTAVPLRTTDAIDFARHVGAIACQECHPGEAALQERSGHSKTLWKTPDGLADKLFMGKHIRDPERPNVQWSYRLENGVLVADRLRGDQTQSFPLEFGVGSGKHGVTFVTTLEGAEAGSSLGRSGIEHRISYVTATHSLAITPGQAAGESNSAGPAVVPQGRSLTAEQLRACFACHATLTSKSASNQLDTKTMVPNVTCERCHGPGREHIEAVRHGDSDLKILRGLARDESARQISLCGECHRTVRDVAGSKVNTDNLEIVRYQPVGLSMSACYDKARSGLKCTSCHDPHARASSERVAYNDVCLSCHQTTKQRICSVSPRVNCIDCHMPERKVPGGSRFTDHWIRIRPQAQIEKPADKERAKSAHRPLGAMPCDDLPSRLRTSPTRIGLSWEAGQAQGGRIALAE